MTLHIKRRWKTNWLGDYRTEWSRTKNLFVNINGAWTPVKKVFINRFGEWKQVEPGTGITSFTQTGTDILWQVPPFVRTIYLSGVGGGGGAGNVVDGGDNNDKGGAGAGGSGQRVIDFAISVIPNETVTIRVGAGGGNAGSARDYDNVGGKGGDTTIKCSSGTYTLTGGAGGKGGVGYMWGKLYEGGVTSTVNSKMPITTSNGASGTTGGAKGGAGLVYNTSTGTVSFGVGQPGKSYANGGTYQYALDATEYGGGGAGGYFGYIRQDNGNHPGWGGKGKGGLVVIKW